MTEEAYKRRLAPVPSVDLADFSRLMPENEETFVRTLTTYRKKTTHLIRHHRVQEADSPGGHLPAGVALQENSAALMGSRGEPWQP